MRRVSLVVLVVVGALFAGSSSASALTIGLNWDGNHESRAELLESVQKSGASVLHLPLQYAPGNWTENDLLVKEAWERGITIVPTLESSSNRFLLPSSPEWGTWLAWVREAVEKYGINGEFWSGKAKPTPITAWEVWNEPNVIENNPQLPQPKAECKELGQTYYQEKNNCIQPQHYATFLKNTASAIQAGSEELTAHKTDVLFGGLITQVGEDWGEFLAKASAKEGLSADVTGVAFHPYAFAEGAIGTIHDIENLRNELDNKLGAGGKSIWITELGWPVAGETPVGGVSTEAEQGGRLTEAFNWIKSNAAGDNIQVAAWYNIRDFGGPKWDGHSGLQREDGSYRPAWQAFTELSGSAPAAETLGAGGTGSFQATLRGNVNPNGMPTSYHFQWGQTSAYGNETPVVGAESNHEIRSVNETIWGLAPNETYHYRIVATSSLGTVVGADRTFTTRTVVSFPDAAHEDSISYWSFDPTAGWLQTSLLSHSAAAGSHTEMFNYEGRPHIVFVDADRENRLTDWHWVLGEGWVEAPIASDPVAAGASPAVVMVNGVPQVYFVDAYNNTLSMVAWTPGGWQQTRLFGDEIAKGTSPAPIDYGGTVEIYYVDASKSNNVAALLWSPTSLNQVVLYGDPAAAGTSPHVLYNNQEVRIFYVDGSQGNNVAVWVWGSTLEQHVFYGDPVAPGTDIDALDKGNEAQIYFVDPKKNNSVALWKWTASSISQTFLFGDPITEGTSPDASLNGDEVLVFFADAETGNRVSAWEWSSTSIEQRQFFGDPLTSGSSPATQ